MSGAAGTGTPPAAQYWQAPTTFTLGGGGAGPDFTGWVAKDTVYNAASDTVRQSVEAYVNNLYGISSTQAPLAPFLMAGTYTTAPTVTISTITSGSQYCYTTNGTTPSSTRRHPD